MKRWTRLNEVSDIKQVDAYLAIAPIKKASSILSKKEKEYETNQKKKDKIKDQNSKEFQSILDEQMKLENEMIGAVEELVNTPIIRKLSK